jgi:hypothetical protein
MQTKFLSENIKTRGLYRDYLYFQPIYKHDVLRRTNRLLFLIRHGPHWKLSVQQFFYCCVCIRYRGNDSTKPLPSNDRENFTKPLPSNNERDALTRTHAHAHTHTHTHYINRRQQQRDTLTTYAPNQHLNYTHFTEFTLFIWPTYRNMYLFMIKPRF